MRYRSLDITIFILIIHHFHILYVKNTRPIMMNINEWRAYILGHNMKYERLDCRDKYELHAVRNILTSGLSMLSTIDEG